MSALELSSGTVYLLHLDRPYAHARHYCGWARDLEARLEELKSGRGSPLMAAVAAAGITWRLARTWPGDRETARRIRRQGGLARQCPLCGVVPRGAADRSIVAALPELYPQYADQDEGRA